MSSYPPSTAAYGKSGLSAEAREETIGRLAYLVRLIAGRMAAKTPASVLFDELVSAGCLGLIDAVDRFDSTKDVDIKTYATYRIRGAILDELRHMDWYSRSMRKKIQEIDQAMQAVGAREGRPAKDWEVAKEMDLSIENYHQLLTDIHGVALVSLDETIKNENADSLSGKSFKDQMPGEEDPAKQLAAAELKQVVADAIRTLSAREQTVISLYYYDELTLKEIGQVLGVTESRICQIHSAVLIKLQSRLKGYRDNP
jgi:RNA polymerase sigma factor for flagellar operon FliA